MTTRIDLERKALADSYRDAYEEYLCSEDDARKTVVAFNSETPEHVLDDARRAADDLRGELDDTQSQIGLTENERRQFDFSSPRVNIPWARSVKAIGVDEGVDDWVAHADPTLSVDEHRDVMKRAGREGGGRRMDNQDSAEVRAGRAARTANAEECDHARGHCEHGDPDACEFLTDVCGVDQEDVEDLLDEPDPDAGDGEDEIAGKALGALKQSWGGYQGAVSALEAALDEARENWELAQQAARSINSIRAAHGQDPLHFENLEEVQADLTDLARLAAADCHECHADHTGHEHEVTRDDREDIRAFVDGGRSSTDVGSGGETGSDPTDVVEHDDQRDLAGEHADDQTKFSDGETGERGEGEIEDVVDENPGGLRADQRDDPGGSPDTEQQVPDFMNVAEGGQRTL